MYTYILLWHFTYIFLTIGQLNGIFIGLLTTNFHFYNEEMEDFMI